MGNQSSQLEKPDSLDQSEHAAQANYIRGASDNDDADASQKSHETHTPSYLNPPDFAEGFAFSSQAPQTNNPLAQSYLRDLDLKPDPDADTDAYISPDNTADPKSHVYNFQGGKSIDARDIQDSPEQPQPQPSRISKKQRRTRKHSSPTSEAHRPESNMTSFTSQNHKPGSSSLGAYSQEEPGSQVDQPDAFHHLSVPSSEKSAKRGRKGKKKQHRAQVDGTQVLEADPTYSHYPPIDNSEFSLHEDDNIPQTSQAEIEEPKSKKRKRKSKHHGVPQGQNHLDYSYGAETNLDPLSTPADERTAPTSLTNDHVDYIDPALTIGAPSQKRKSKDQGKKGRKKRKQDHGIPSDPQAGLDGIDQESQDYNMDQAMGDVAGSGEEPTPQLNKGVAANNSPSTEHSFGNVAQSLYADHVRSQNPETSPLEDLADASPEQHHDDELLNVGSGIKPDRGFGEDSDVEPTEDNGDMKIDNHSEGSDSEAQRIDDDVNSPEASASEYSGGEITKYETKSDSSDAPDYGRYSEDLGLDNTADLADTDDNDALDDYDYGSEQALSSVVPDQIEVPSSVPVQEEEMPIADPAQDTHNESSSGQKKAPKPSLQNQTAEETPESIAESPSPVTTAAPRQRRSRGRPRKQAETESHEAVAGPSKSAPKDKPKQPKITSLLKGGPSAPAKHTTPAPKSEHSEKDDKVTKGVFSLFELRNIDEAVDRWAQSHNLTEYARNELIHSNPKTVNSTEFWDSVHATCPNRLRQKVINQCRRKYHNFVARGTWTPEQNDELAEMYELHGNKYTVIGKLINRHPEDVRDRVRNYIICGKNLRKNAWSHEEESQLVDIVNEATEHIKNLQRNGKCSADSRPDDLVDWQLVSEKMNHTRSRLQCINKWKILKSQLEGKSIDGGDVLSFDELLDKARTEAEAMDIRERYKLAKAVLNSGANAESRIPWAKIRAQRIGYTSSGKRLSRPTLMIAWHRLKLTNPDWKTLTVPEIAQQLCAEYKRTETLEYASLESPQLAAERKDMEHKFNKLLKSHGTNKTSSAKTPFHAVNSDDEDEESTTGQSANVASNSDRAPSTDLGFETDVAKHSSDEALEAEVEAEDSELVVKPKKSRNGRNNEQVADSSKSNGVTPSKKSDKTEENAPVSSAKRILARRKTSRAKRPQPPATDSDEQSSDTNASDVESIPARRPE